MKRRDFLKSIAGLAGLGLLTPKQLAELESLEETALEEVAKDKYQYDGTHPYILGGSSFRYVEDEDTTKFYSDDCSCNECVRLRGRDKKDGWLL